MPKDSVQELTDMWNDESDEEEETPVTDTVDGAVGGAPICPPGEEVEINMEVAQRKRVIDLLLDKFEVSHG